MLEDAPHLTAYHIPFALTQILDLLGDVLAIEAVIAGAQGTQHFGLVLRPGVEIVVVARSVRHAVKTLEARRNYTQLGGLGGFFSGWDGRGGAAGDANDRCTSQQQEDAEHDKTLGGAP